MKVAHVPVLLQDLSQCAGIMESSWLQSAVLVEPSLNFFHVAIEFSLLGCYRLFRICICNGKMNAKREANVSIEIRHELTCLI